MTQRKYMPARIAFVLLFTALSFAQQPEAQSQAKKDEKPAFQLETFYMAIMTKAGNFDSGKAASLAKSEHDYWQSIATKSDLILGGPCASNDSLAAAFVFRAADQVAASKVAGADPLVQQKLWTAFVIPWGTKKDGLKPLKTYDPSISYYLGFLKRGDKWSPEETPERARIQEAHLKNIGRLNEMGKLVAAGPFMEDNDYRGIFVFKTATMEEANELTNTDPAVQAGRLRIELHEWRLPAEAFQAK